MKLNAFENEIFNHYREQQAKIKKAIKLLKENDYEVIDRKSTRLNSSHGYISYAVFCLKKKNIQQQTTHNQA